MFCSKCGNWLKEGEQFCSKCGTPVESKAPDKLSEMKEKAGKTVSNVFTATVGQIQKAVGKNRKIEELLQKMNLQEKIKTAGKKPIYAGAAAVLAVLIFLNFAWLSNACHKMFSSPAGYYQYVEKKTIKEVTSDAGEWYDSYILDALNVYNKSVTGKVEAEIGEDGQELLGLLGLTGMDLSWLESVSVNVSTNVKDDTIAADASLKLNKNDIVSGSVLMDIADGAVYARIPEINSRYIGIETDEIGFDAYQSYYEQQDRLKQIEKACPSQAEAEKIAGRYLRIMLECVEDVAKSKTTIRAEGIEQKCTELKVTLDAETRTDMMRAVLMEARDDKELKKLIINMSGAVDESIDAEEAYDQFLDSIDETLELLDQNDSYGYGYWYGYGMSQKIVMKVYVDGKGEIKGRVLDTGYATVRYLMPEKGKKYGCELSIQAGGNKVQLTGSGKKSGNTIRGDFKFKYGGASLMDITVNKLNTKDLKRGKLNGGIIVEMSSGISSLLGYGYGYVPGLSVLEDVKISMDFDSSKNSYACKAGVIYDEQDMGNISLSVKTGNGSRKAAPDAGNTVMLDSLDDVAEWAESIDVGKLISAMEAADVPSDMVDMLEDFSDELEDADADDLMRLLYYLF